MKSPCSPSAIKKILLKMFEMERVAPNDIITVSFKRHSTWHFTTEETQRKKRKKRSAAKAVVRVCFFFLKKSF